MLDGVSLLILFHSKPLTFMCAEGINASLKVIAVNPNDRSQICSSCGQKLKKPRRFGGKNILSADTPCYLKEYITVLFVIPVYAGI